jgi:hypothetical protein
MAGLRALPLLAAESPQERGRQMIEKTIFALGGDAFRNMRTRTETGRAYSFYREQLSGLAVARIYTKYMPAEDRPGPPPLRQMQRQVFGKKGEDTVLFLPDEAYDITFRGAKPLPEDRVKQFRDTALHDIFYILRMRLKEPGLVFEHRGSEVVENQPVETIDVFDAENRNVTVWLNSTTLLPTKQRFTRWDQTINDRREEVTRFAKYRDIGNRIMWPYDVQRERDTEKIFEIYSEKVTADEPLSDDLFELPRGIKLLKK